MTKNQPSKTAATRAAVGLNPILPTNLDIIKRLSFERPNSNGKLKYSWEVDLSPFKLDRIARQ